MRRGLICLTAIALALPITPAVAKQPPPGRTVVVTVKGVPRASKATIVLKGRKHVQRKVTTAGGKRAVRHLKPGTYRVRPDTFTTPAGTWTGTAVPKKVKVTKRKGARVRVSYSLKTTAPPSDDSQLPDTPFPKTQPPSSVVLVSQASGAVGNKMSQSPTWSPDGQYLAFASCATNLGGTPDTNCYLYKATLSDGSVARITTTRMTDIVDWGGEPAWSPDGTRLAFTTMSRLAAGDTDTNKDVYVVSAAGANPQRVSQPQAGGNMTGAPAVASAPQWAPDSTRIMFRATATNLAAGTGDLYIKTLTGGAVARTGAAERSEGARWSPDGRIAFTAGSETFNPATYNWDRVYDVFTAAGTGASVTAATADHGVFGAPTWAPSGSALAYSTSAALLPADTNEMRDIYTTAGLRVSTGPGGEQIAWDAGDPVWSPDGQKVAFTAEGSGPSTILVKNLATGAVTQLVDPRNGTECVRWETDEESGETYCGQYGYYGASEPAWSPDSTRIAFTSSYPNLAPGDTNGTRDVFIATL